MVDLPAKQDTPSPKEDVSLENSKSAAPEQPKEKVLSRSTPRTTVKVADLLKVEPKKESAATATASKKEQTSDFTTDSLKAAWDQFAASRKKFQAEYQLLSQPFEIEATKIVLHLLSPVQETMLANLRNELVTHLRESLRNDLINVTGILKENEDRKVMYTSRDKFEYLQEKIPLLKEFKDRLGLDTDF